MWILMGLYFENKVDLNEKFCHFLKFLFCRMIS